MTSAQQHDVLDAALAFYDAGCSVIPVATDGTKRPRGAWKTYQTARAQRDQIQQWFGTDWPGLGLVTGAISSNLEMLELEGRAVQDGMLGQLTEMALASGLAEIWTRITRGYMEATPSGGVHFLYRVDGRPIPGNTKLARRPATEAELAENPDDRVKVLAETRGEGGFVVVAPSHGPTHPTGKPWQRASGGPGSIPTLTAAEHDALMILVRTLDAMPGLPEQTSNTSTNSPAPLSEADAFLLSGRTTDNGISPGDDYNQRASWDEILLSAGWTVLWGRRDGERGWRRPGKDTPGISATTGYGDRGDWLYVFSSSTTFPCEQTLTKFAAYAHLEHAGNYSNAAKALRARGYGSEPRLSATTAPGGDVHAAFATAKDGHDEPSEPAPAVPASPLGPTTMTTIVNDAGLTDVGNADLLVARHGHEMRYVPERGSWLRWGGTHWSWDNTSIIVEHAKATVLAIPTEHDSLTKHRKRSLSRRAIEAMIALARTHPTVATPAALLDSDPYALCTPGGVVDLHTGQLHGNRPDDLHTRSTAITVDTTMPTPRWDAFLAQTFGGDQTLLGFVQRLAGYSATGIVTHHVLPFLHGPGGNGKSAFTEVMRRVLGDYAASAPSSFLMAGQQQHETEIARLAGLRMVICSEVNQEQRFDEAKVKILTGGDALTARFMRQDHFTFVPTHHLWLMGNHQPRVTSGGDSFWRRLRLIPFTYKVPDDKKIDGLDRLLVDEEGPGILAWIVEGARLALTTGLAEPSTVLAATKTYAAEEDALARFVEDRCHLGGGALVKTNTTEVRRAYTQWCNDEGEKAVSPQVFGRELRTRYGVDQSRSHGHRFYAGLALLADANEPDPDPAEHWTDR